MENGWIKVHRKMTEWEWYKDPNTSRLFFHLLLTVNHKPGKWQGIDIPAGARITSIRKLAAETRLSEQNVRTAIKHLISTREITQSATARYTLIKLTNYEKYQGDNTVTNEQATQCQHSPNTVLTTNKNNKNNKNERMKEDYKTNNQQLLILGPFQNVRLGAVDLQDFLSRFPETGQAAIDTLSEMLQKDPQKRVTNTLRYLEKVASNPELKPKPKSGPFSGKLPEWYSDTGSKFVSEQERQRMLEEVEKAKAEFEENMKGKK